MTFATSDVTRTVGVPADYDWVEVSGTLQQGGDSECEAD
jgi:hypothetical protein